ncbi:MAG TPA: penicillin-binding transpeptidase domain-containing protein, partial [Chlamydiales bacterium]|nr:penicillin-binding transpeptidase domain-containing protein [Chlamydiales bacterium]
KEKLFQLKEQAYTMNDHVGLSGLEASFEKELRGFVGKSIFFSDAKGNFIRDIAPSRPPVSGKRLLLTISSELQEFGEKLLAQYEQDRERVFLRDTTGGKEHKEPWVRGGAIVAIDPTTGQVVAMCSHPRFDPNDFVHSEKRKNVLRWVENEAYQQQVWDKKLPLFREFVQDATQSPWSTEEKELSWNTFITMMCAPRSPLVDKLSPKRAIQDLIVLQRSFNELMKRAPGESAENLLQMMVSQPAEDEETTLCSQILSRWFEPIEEIKEKILLIDLSRLVLSHEDFSPELVQAVGTLSIEDFRKLSQAFIQLSDSVRKKARQEFHNTEFKQWRQSNEKQFLKEIRKNEVRLKKQAKPYLDYIEKEEARQFQRLWRMNEFERILAAIHENEKLHSLCTSLDPSLVESFLHSLKGFSRLSEPLYGTYRGLQGKQLKHLAGAFLKTSSGGALASYAFHTPTIQGSIFKLVTAYAGLKQRFNELNSNVSKQDLRLFECVDHFFKKDGKNFVGAFTDGRAIPQLYKGGRIPKSLHANLGRMDLVKAIETSSNPYFSLLAGDYLKKPEALFEAAKDFGYGKKSGIDLFGEFRGAVPEDLATNRTGLYATAIGQHTLLTTPLQTSLMLSAIANKGVLIRPQMAHLLAGKSVVPSFFSKESPYKPQIQIHEYPLSVRETIFMPDEIRQTLLEGMQHSVERAMKDQGALPRLYAIHPEMKKAFFGLKGQFVGKTSTAEVIERVGLEKPQMYRHIWFGGISFEADSTHFGCPELVVVVYLRFGGYGKEAAPIAAQMVQKWREIVAKN